MEDNKKIKIEIKSFGGAILFSYESKGNNIKTTVEKAVEKKAYLSGAYLRGSYLSGANLSGADLSVFRSDLNILKYQKGKLVAFKYLNKKMVSPYQGSLYEVGKTYKESDVDTNELVECGRGLNVATLEWCLRNTNRNIENHVYIEVEFDAKNIVAIPYFTDGKFRVSELKVVRVVPEEELKKIVGDVEK